METNNNPLRQMVIKGEARNDFFNWHMTKYGELPHNVDLWPIAKQLERFSKFFGKTINHADDFYQVLYDYDN